MTITHRARFAAAAVASLALAIPAGASAAQHNAAHDVAAAGNPKVQRITTDVRIVKHTFVLRARARALTLAMQVTGTETWTDATGTHVIPLSASPVSVDFGTYNVVTAPFPLYRGATVVITYTAQAADEVFASACYGGRAIFDGGNWNIADQPC